MPSRKLRAPCTVPVEMLREAASARVHQSSLRVAAGEIGMSHRGLEDFIRGTRPHPQTVSKLTTWYIKGAAAGDFVPSPEVLAAALSIVVKHLPLEHQESAVGELLDCARALTARHGADLPPWLAPIPPADAPP